MDIGRGRPREHPKDTSKGSRDLRSLRMLHNFRLRIAKGTPKGSSDLWSHPVAMLLPHKKKKRGKKSGHAQNLLPVKATSSHVTFTSGQ